MQSPKQIMVSVFMITYNHEKYICQAIESALKQECDFEFEIVVGEDCSTDSTRQLLVELQKKYPDKINTLLNKQNIGMAPNFVKTLRACRGKYIAFLEGDDYWTDPRKLEKQVRFLEANPQLSGVCSNLQRIKADGSEAGVMYDMKSRPADVITAEHMFNRNWVCSPTVMFKAAVLKSAPQAVYEQKVVDYYAWSYAATKGNIGYQDEIMAVYRIHETGAWNKMGLRKRILLDTENIIKVNELFCTDKKLREQNIDRLRLKLIWNLQSRGFSRDAFILASKLFFRSVIRGNFKTARIVLASIRKPINIANQLCAV